MPELVRFVLDGPPPERGDQIAEAVHALVLGWIEAASPADSRALHDANQAKPASVTWVRPCGAGRCAFEVGLLPDWLPPLVRAGVRHTGPVVWLAGRRYRLSAVETLRRESWECLAEAPEAPASWTLRLHSPTAAHAPNADGEPQLSVVTPIPRNYFGSWLRRWNDCHPPEGPGRLREHYSEGTFLDLVARWVGVRYFRGGTAEAVFTTKGHHHGFQGDVTFELLRGRHGKAPPAGFALALSALVRLAPYCGTGVNTMRGMGQTAVLDLAPGPQGAEGGGR